LFTQHTGFWRGGVFGGGVGDHAVSSPGYEGEAECKIIRVFLLSSTS